MGALSFDVDVVVITAVGAAILAAIVLAGAGPVAEFMIRTRSRRLPHDLSDRLPEEWVAEVRIVEGRVAKLAFAFGLVMTSNKTLSDAAAPVHGSRTIETFDVRVYSDFFTRAAAYALDLVVIGVIAVPMVWLMPDVRSVSGELAQLGFATVAYALVHLYAVVRFGGSPGKLIMKLRIVAVDESPLTLQHALLRIAPDYLSSVVVTIAMVVTWPYVNIADFDAMPAAQQVRYLRSLHPSWYPAWSFIAAIWHLCDVGACLANDDRRSLHDRLAGTVVIVRGPKTIVVPDYTPAKSTSMFQ